MKELDCVVLELILLSLLGNVETGFGAALFFPIIVFFPFSSSSLVQFKTRTTQMFFETYNISSLKNNIYIYIIMKSSYNLVQRFSCKQQTIKNGYLCVMIAYFNNRRVRRLRRKKWIIKMHSYYYYCCEAIILFSK